jgi:hypothetical protein
MTLARVSFKSGNVTSEAVLGPKGWAVAGNPRLARAFDLLWPLSRYGPADGDAVTRAANELAESMGGEVQFVRPVPSSAGLLH